jgi:PKD repeat protein
MKQIYFLFIILLITVTASFAQTVITDKTDYEPSENMTITGSDFYPNEELQVKILDLDRDLIVHEQILIADTLGNFVLSWTNPPLFNPDDILWHAKVTVAGLYSGYAAEVPFTDGASTRIRANSMSPSSGSCGSTISVYATLEYKISNPDNWGPLTGRTVSFTLGSSSGSGVTNSAGVATANLTVPQNANQLEASYAGGGGFNATDQKINFSVIGPCATPPQIICPTNIVVNNDAGLCGAYVTFAASATGTPTPTITYSHSPGSLFSAGTTTVTAIATNIAGSDTCSFTVTVNDVELPSIIAPSAIVQSNDAGYCYATVSLGTPVTADNCGVASVTNDAPATFPVGTTIVTWTVTDIHGNSNTATQSVTIQDTELPVVICSSNIITNVNTGNCSAVVNYPPALVSDNCGIQGVSYSQTSGSVFPLGTTTVTCEATDIHGNKSYCNFTITVINHPPVAEAIIAPIDPISINTAVSISGSFSDIDLPGDNHNVEWSWGDGSSTAGTIAGTGTTRNVSGSHTYTSAGVYTILLTITDACGAQSQAKFEYIVVYDPDGGFVTGGGWIDSPLGAYRQDISLTGKATFGFVSKYQKGAKVPTGNTEFQFKAGNLNFKSSIYEWLVISGAKAQYKGSGTINGTGNYGFILTSIDGQISGGGGVDKFRIKIWDSNSSILYDNQFGSSDTSDPTTAIAGGSIVIHKTTKSLTNIGNIEEVAPALPEKFELYQNYPNPFNPTTEIKFDLPEVSWVKIIIYDVLGNTVKILMDGEISAGRQQIAWNGVNSNGNQSASGIYFFRLNARSLTSGNEFSSIKKMILLR